MTATAKAGAPRRKPPAPPALPQPEPPETVLDFTTEPDGEEKREVLFRVDGREYTIPVEPSASIALAVMESVARFGDGATGQMMATREALRLMLGDEGYRALLSVPDLKAADFAHLAQVCADRAMGTLQGEGGSPNP